MKQYIYIYIYISNVAAIYFSVGCHLKFFLHLISFHLTSLNQVLLCSLASRTNRI